MRLAILSAAIGLFTLFTAFEATAQRVTTPTEREEETTERLPTRGTDVARTSGGRAEFVTVGPSGEAVATADALRAAGAAVIASRPLPNLRRHLLVFDPRGVSLDEAELLLAEAAPSTAIDLHHFYRYAQGQPRLFAARMIGLPETGACRVSGVRVGIIDGPVNPRHPALSNAAVTVTSVLSERDRGTDANHGTGVAALIVGEDPGGSLNGISPGARLFAASAFGQESRGPAADVERIGAALDWLTGNQVKIINMSFAGPPNSALQNLLSAAAARGAILIAAAGNGGTEASQYPAAAPEVITVTAIDAAARRYRRANTGAHIEFAAPGVDLYVASRGGGTYASGTSFAAPIVTALAVQAARRGAASTPAIRNALRRNASDLGPAGRDSHYGWGLVRSGGC